MRIRLRRSGGFAGLQTPPVEIDSLQLPTDKARELDQLLADARLFDPQPGPAVPAGPQPPPPPAPPAPARDAFQYDLSVEDGGRAQAVRLHEGAMRPEAERLVRWLAQQARATPGARSK
jgi:Emfourin